MATRQQVLDEFNKYYPDDRTGLLFRRNRINGFVVCELDFVADPAKRDLNWIDTERRQMPPKVWAVEMLRSWETFAGKPVYEGAFHEHLHVAKLPIKPLPHAPIIRGWDFGGNQSVVICQVQKSRLVVLDELPNRGQNTEQFAPEVIAYCNENYPTDIYIDVIDPNGMWDTQRAKKAGSNADAMREAGLRPKPAPDQDPGRRIRAVTSLLMRLCPDGLPALIINPHCTMLIRGFKGGYHYPDKPTQRGKLLPVKNLFSHIHDALQYACGRMKSYEKAQVNEEIGYEKSLVNYKFHGK